MKAFEVDGIRYHKGTTAELRETAIDMRNQALNAGAMDWAVSLSHIIVLLGKVVEEIEE